MKVSIALVMVAAQILCLSGSADGLFESDSTDPTNFASPLSNVEEPILTREYLEDRFNIVIPQGWFRADVWGLRVSDRGKELEERFDNAIRENREWWLEVTEKPTHIDDLPYHPNMGLTESEYDEMRRLLKERVFAKVDNQVFKFRDHGEGRFKVHIDYLSAKPYDFVIDLKREVIESRYGSLPYRGGISAVDLDVPTDPWLGHLWSLETPLERGKLVAKVEFALGRQIEHKRGIVFFRLERRSYERLVERVIVVLIYDDPGN